MDANLILRLRLIALFMAISIFNPLFSQEYRVYSIEGKVEKRAADGWHILGRTDNVTSDDVIRISRASTLRILDKGKKQIYTFSQKGEAKLQSLVNKAKEENSSLTGKIIAEAKRNTSAEKSHKSLGAAHRDMDDENLEAIYAAVVASLRSGEGCGELIVEKVKAEEGLMYLKCTNNSDEGLFVNILIPEDDSQKWRPLIDSREYMAGIFINAGETLAFPHLLLTDDGTGMTAVAFPIDFDIEELADMLENRLEPLETEVKDVSVYFVK